MLENKMDDGEGKLHFLEQVNKAHSIYELAESMMHDSGGAGGYPIIQGALEKMIQEYLKIITEANEALSEIATDSFISGGAKYVATIEVKFDLCHSCIISWTTEESETVTIGPFKGPGKPRKKVIEKLKKQAEEKVCGKNSNNYD